MKIFLVVLLIAIIAIYSNPDGTQHALHLRDAQMRLKLAHPDFLDYCEFYNFGVFSVTAYLGAPVSVGFFGNVLVQYDELKGSLQDFQKHQTELLIDMNGPPPSIGLSFDR